MIFRFVCDSCGKTEDIWKQSWEDIPGAPVCECGEQMRRDWRAKIHLPNRERDDDGGFFDHMKYKLKTTRPSGRGKIYY